jgi:predicted MFS family arabinose efflux permease
MSRAMTVLFAVAGGAAVANTYWAGPLLRDIAETMDVPIGAAGLLITVTQVGYALGVFLLVPLGDRFNPRRLVPAVMAACAAALAAAGLAPTYPVLVVTLTLVGFTTVAAQLLIPLAADLASDDQHGATVGTIVSGLLIGILLSRTISGIFADAFGWRAIYLLAAGITASLTLVVARLLPATPARASTSYVALLRSVFAVVRRDRVVQVTLALGALNVSVFSRFWTALTFLLSSQPYSYGAAQIGLVGLVGLGGALAARRVGRVHDMGKSTPATGAAIGVAVLALAISTARPHSLLAILIAVLLLDVAVQAGNVLHQTRLVNVDAEARGRINTAFVTSGLTGGAGGSALGSGLWSAGGWGAVMTAGLVMLTLGVVLWWFGRHTPRAACSSPSSASTLLGHSTAMRSCPVSEQHEGVMDQASQTG